VTNQQFHEFITDPVNAAWLCTLSSVFHTFYATSSRGSFLPTNGTTR
jgi:hypothetical protein